jgi:hypothetical protein
MKKNFFNIIYAVILCATISNITIPLHAARPAITIKTALETRLPLVLSQLDKWFTNLVHKKSTTSYHQLASDLKTIERNLETIICEMEVSQALFDQEVHTLLNMMLKIFQNMSKKIDSMGGCSNQFTFIQEFKVFKDKTLSELEQLIIKLRTIESHYTEPQKGQLNNITKIALDIQNRHSKVNTAEVALIRLPEIFKSMKKGR